MKFKEIGYKFESKVHTDYTEYSIDFGFLTGISRLV